MVWLQLVQLLAEGDTPLPLTGPQWAGALVAMVLLPILGWWAKQLQVQFNHQRIEKRDARTELLVVIDRLEKQCDWLTSGNEELHRKWVKEMRDAQEARDELEKCREESAAKDKLIAQLRSES